VTGAPVTGDPPPGRPVRAPHGLNGLHLELDVEFASAEEFVSIAYDWIGGLVEEFGEDPWLPFDDPRRDDPDMLPGPRLGPPGWRGRLDWMRWDTGARRTEGSRRLSKANLRWFRAALAGIPHTAKIHCTRLDEDGQLAESGLNASVGYDPESPGWARLSANLTDALFIQPRIAAANQARWLSALRRYADRLNPGFGQIGYSYTNGATGLEDCLRGVPGSYSHPDHTVGECRSVLRGYSWLTVVPEELLPAAGGVDALAGSGAFAVAEPLTAGGAWLLATSDYRDYGQTQAAAVWRALRPILRRGTVTPPKWSMPGKSPCVLVFEDAAPEPAGPGDRGDVR
jgi:hypothetical protein